MSQDERDGTPVHSPRAPVGEGLEISLWGRFFLFISLLVIGEMVIMLALGESSGFGSFWPAILDAATMGILTGVGILFLFFFPLLRFIRENLAIRQELKTANLLLEERVQEQTSALRTSLEHLQEESGKRSLAAESLARNLDTQVAFKNILRSALEDAPIEEFLQEALGEILKIPWLCLEGRGCIFLVHAPQNVLELKAQQGLHQALLDSCRRVPVGKCLCGRAALRKELLFCPEIGPDHEITYGGIQPHGHWCLPILDHGSVLGVLNIYVHPGRMPESGESDFLARIADILALAIRRRTVESRLQQLFQAVEQGPVMVMIADRGGSVEFVNQAFASSTGYSKEFMVGKNPRILHANETPEETLRELWTTILDGRTWKGHLRNRRLDGSLFWGSAQISPVKNRRGEITHVLALMEDVTEELARIAEKKVWEERLANAQRFQTIGTLASGIAHDFNNILLAIDGFAELGLDSSPEEAQDSFREILSAARRGADLVARLRNISRPGNPERTRFRLHHEVQAVCRLLRPVLPLGTQLKMDLVSEGDEILANPIEVHRMIMNLCLNAVYAMKAKDGTLSVRTVAQVVPAPIPGSLPPGRTGEFVLLRVTDTGTGIPPDVLSRMFEPFYTTKPPLEGTGLGLSVVLEGMKECRGFLRVETQVGSGTTFDLFFPRPTPERG